MHTQQDRSAARYLLRGRGRGKTLEVEAAESDHPITPHSSTLLLSQHPLPEVVKRDLQLSRRLAWRLEQLPVSLCPRDVSPRGSRCEDWQTAVIVGLRPRAFFSGLLSEVVVLPSP